MTTACQLSEDQFHCSFCHDVFTEPVTLPCGHNFCKKCLEQHWTGDAKCMCPYCKKMFFYRPELKVNTFIAKLTAQFLQSQYRATKSLKPQAAKAEELLCGVCPDPKQQARNSCLLCLSSYCESHLKPHLNMCGLKKHHLMELKRDMAQNNTLQLFCRSKQLCVYVGHEIVPLTEASKQQRLLLQKTEADIEDKVSKRRKKIDELRSSVKVSNEAADREISDGVTVFTALKESVVRRLDLLISDITRKKTDKEQQVQGFIRELEQELSELEKRGAEVKLLSESDDPLQLLRNSSKLSPESPTKDWTDINICPQTHEGVVVRALSELQQDFNKETRSLFEAELKRVKTKEVDVTLDTGTASSHLRVDQTDKQSKTPDCANKSDGLFVFAKETFSESFYFEAEVRGKVEWTLGVAQAQEQEPIKRKGPLALNPQNGFWTIGVKNKDMHISDNPEMTVFTKFRPERVGVFVDYKEGIVSFYDVDAQALIYFFTDFPAIVELSPFCRYDRVQNGNSASLICGTSK